MFARIVLAAALSLAVTWPVIAIAAECPTLDREDIQGLLRKAPTCDRALALFRTCALSSSGDIAFGDIVQQKCEAGFVAKLTAAQKQVYDRTIAACGRKYQNEDGTMYRSFEAFCRAGVAQSYAKQYAKAPDIKVVPSSR